MRQYDISERRMLRGLELLGPLGLQARCPRMPPGRMRWSGMKHEPDGMQQDIDNDDHEASRHEEPHAA